MDINKKALIRQLSDRYGYTIKGTTEVVDNLLALILENIEDGNSVSLYGFGCFDVLKRKAHVCPNRQTGKMRDIPEHYIPRFYPGARMHLAVRKWELNNEDGE